MKTIHIFPAKHNGSCALSDRGFRKGTLIGKTGERAYAPLKRILEYYQDKDMTTPVQILIRLNCSPTAVGQQGTFSFQPEKK